MTTGWPLGPPDSWVSMESGLQSVALALRSSGRATVTTATFDGRPVWVRLRERTLRPSRQVRARGGHDRQADLPAAPRASVEGRRPPTRVHLAMTSVRDAPVPEVDLHVDPDKAHEDHAFRRRLPQVAARQDRGDAGLRRPATDPAADRLSPAVGRRGRTLRRRRTSLTEGRDVDGAAVRARLRRDRPVTTVTSPLAQEARSPSWRRASASASRDCRSAIEPGTAVLQTRRVMAPLSPGRAGGRGKRPAARSSSGRGGGTSAVDRGGPTLSGRSSPHVSHRRMA